MNREQRRALDKAQKSQSPAEKKMGEQIMMFGKLPDMCLVCEALYDKKSKEMANTWFVVQDKGNVRLYCPECWEKAQGVLQEYKRYLESKYTPEQQTGDSLDVHEPKTDSNV
jgi:hypothetical protein